MPSIRVSKELNSAMYFITFTVKRWYYIFDRYNRWEIILNSLQFCQKNKKLKIYAYVFMLNHIHLIIKSPDSAGFIRDFKKHTAYELMKNLQQTEFTVAELFKKDDGKYEIWQKTNMPKIIETEKYFWQKKKYIENNPVRKGYVALPEHWIHSSAFVANNIDLAKIDE